MTSSREEDERVMEILAAARRKPAGEREAYLRTACAGDEDLRREVLDALSSEERMGGFLQQPVAMIADGNPTSDSAVTAAVQFAAGLEIGQYRIESKLGEGGMSSVWLALDTRLGRRVAIKFLSDDLADAEARRRFQREAQMASSLNHPHIVTVYDTGEFEGRHYLVTEYVDGGTLKDWIKDKRRTPKEVAELLTGVADGLAAAHQAGILHRDIKPLNILIARNGYAKLADFGLAKLAENGTVDLAARLPEGPTRPGLILGTIAYMSPEQASGQALDSRSDIFSFGVVLYEMFSGRRPFGGRTDLEVLKTIIDGELPPLSEEVPEAYRNVVEKALEKSPAERYQSMREMVVDLRRGQRSQRLPAPGVEEAIAPVEDGVASPEQLAGIFTPAGQRKAGRQWLAWGVAALLCVTVVLTMFLFRGKRPPVTTTVRFEIRLPAGASIFTFSPDGRQLAFLGPGTDGRNVVWIRALDSLEPHPLPGTENILVPVFWSPDSRFIAFQTGDKLKKIDISGGPPQEICDTPALVLGGGWNRDGTIIFGTVGNGIMQVPAAGGVPALLTTTEGRNEVHTFPSFLQDGQHFFYLRAPENPGIYLGSLDVKPEQQSSRRILSTSVMAVYAASADPRMGHLLFLREGTLLAQAFDEGSLQPQGDPIPVAERVGSRLLAGLFSVSPGGVLAYSAGTGGIGLSHLSWFDRQGKKLGDAGQPGTYSYAAFALSPDGTRLATTKSDPRVAEGQAGIWLLDLLRGVSTRLTFDLNPDSAPVWSPDGSRVAFVAARGGRGSGIYQKASNGAGKEQELVHVTGDPKLPNDWSRDGRFLLYTQRDPRTHADLWVLPLAGNGTPSGSATPFANTEFSEEQGRFSPDARWIAYASDESGRSEIYIQPFPAPPNGGRKTPISRDGGIQPRWRRDGKELFYLSLDGKLMAADVTEGPIFKASVPRVLFQVPLAQIGHGLQALGWDVAPDGKRLLIDSATTSSEPVTVLLNWTAELKKQ